LDIFFFNHIDPYCRIANAFPPNPRKIKRALSLAYFIGKNVDKTDDKIFKQIFPVVLFWSVATTYFPGLTKLVKITPKFLGLTKLVKITPKFLGNVFELVSSAPDIGSLRSLLDALAQDPKRLPWEEEGGKIKSKESMVVKTETMEATWKYLERNPWLAKFANEHLINDRLLYRFLKATVEFFDKMNVDDEGEFDLQYVVEKAGLIS
jgi:hypothetical protein